MLRRAVTPGLLVVVLPTFVPLLQAAASPVATAAWNFRGGAHPFLTPPRSPAVTTTVVAAQDPAAVEASLDLDRPTRRLIQQGLRNEGFDPGEPDGLFGPRTRAAIRRWQEARGVPPTGHLAGTEAALLRGAGAQSPIRSDTDATTAAPHPTARPGDRHTAAQLSAPNNPSSAAVHARRTATDTLPPQPQPHRTPAPPATAPGQLPPVILLDSHLLRAEQSTRNDDRRGALAAMEQIDVLQAEHQLDTPADYHFRYARVWTSLANWERSQASAVRYLELTGRDGEHYLDALTLMNRATAALEDLARERERLAAEAARRRAAEARERAALERRVNAARGVIAEMQFAAIPAGQFTMGTDSPYASYQGPVTTVRITRPFEIGRYEVTQAEWETVMGDDPSQFAGCAQCPVEQLTWDEIHQFISVLNAADRDIWNYRLPTEAEWEYAARAGSTGDRYVRDVEASAWCYDNSEARTHPVGLKRPNAFGLYDVLGNVSEVVQDWLGLYPGGSVVDPVGPSRSTLRIGGLNPKKVTRGGNWFLPLGACALASRLSFTMEMDRGGGIRNSSWEGFRLVRTAE